jgi:hypothetical protein
VPEVHLETLLTDLDADRRYSERRNPQRKENYHLYRDTVITNRLTQRQSVNVPLMKETIRTQLSRAGEPAMLAYEDRDNDTQRELLMNAYWEHVADDSKYEKLDVIDKKNEGLYGRTYTKLNILNGVVRLTVHDPFDIKVDRYTNPVSIDTARRVTHVGIYRTLSDLELNPLYDKAAVRRLRAFFATKRGLIKAAENAEAIAARNERLSEMGVPDMDNPIIGETYVELNEVQQKVWYPNEQQDVIHVVVLADGREKIMDKPLRDLLGSNFFTYTSWAGDIEGTDWESDGAGDIVRVPNQILNVYFSQMVENGVLRGYGMNFYDTTKSDGWSPAGYTPSPWGFYGVPGNPNEMLKHVEVPEIPGRMDEMAMIKTMVETATAATALQKGASPQGDQTLGEVELMIAKADERMKDVPKFARIHAKELGQKFTALVSGAAKLGILKPVKLYKKGASGLHYGYDLDPNVLYSPEGYDCVVTQKAEKEADSLKMIQKLKMSATMFPTNVPLQKILKERTLSWLDLSPEEKKQVMEFEEQAAGLMPGMPLIADPSQATKAPATGPGAIPALPMNA